MRISVCMAAYNGEKYIVEQLRSILDQLGEEDELIVSDDGSTDGTVEKVLSFGDARIKLLRFDGKNIIKNFENALNSASGDYIFLADQDDIWVTDKVQTCLRHLREYDLVFSNVLVFSDDPANSTPLYETGKKRTGILRNIIKNNYIGATMCFRRSVLKRALPFPGRIYMHDIWVAMIAESTGRALYLEEPLVYYRRHGANASQTGGKSENSFKRKISMRFALIMELLKRIR